MTGPTSKASRDRICRNGVCVGECVEWPAQATWCVCVEECVERPSICSIEMSYYNLADYTNHRHD
jgi:hypothetical protein